MKKIIPLITVLTLFTLTSCNKQRTCECVKTMTNIDTGEVTEYGSSKWTTRMSKKKWIKECLNSSHNLTENYQSAANGYAMSEDCELK